MSNQGTIRLKVTNGAPAIEKLWNGRFKLEFLCDNNSPKEDWYYDNISSMLPDYGILQDANFGSGVSEDWEAIPGSVYPNMRLVETEYVFIPSMGDKRVKLTYETLTAAWVEEKSEDTDYELSGLKRVSRTFVALPDTTYGKVVGTSTIDSNGTTLYLGSFKIEKTDAKWSLTEVWLEAGTLSETLDNVGSQKARVIETVGTDPTAPSGYSLASKQESNFEGFQTNRFTFLKDNVVLSESKDKVGSQLAITQEVFNGTPTAPSGYSIANTQESDFSGIPTKRFTFLKPSILSLQQDFVGGATTVQVSAFGMTEAQVDADLSEVTPSHILISQSEGDYEGIKTSTFQYQIDESIAEDYELNGLKRLSITELSSTNFTARDIGVEGVAATPQVGLYLGTQDIDNGGAIKVRESVWLEAGTLRVTENIEAEGVKRVSTTFFGVEGLVVGPVISRDASNYDGFKTIVVSSLQDKDGNSLGANGDAPVSQFDQYINFRYPGEVSIASDVDTISNPTTGDIATTWNSHWYSLIPPVTSEINARVYVFFQTSNSIVASDLTYGGAAGLWNPNQWARGRVDGLGTNYGLTSVRQTAQDKVFNEYTAVSGETNSVSGTAGYADGTGVVTTGAVLLEGSYILPDASYSITVSGGPGRPDGGTYTVQAPTLTPAFDDVDGNQVWKKVIIVATIPTR